MTFSFSRSQTLLIMCAAFETCSARLLQDLSLTESPPETFWLSTFDQFPPHSFITTYQLAFSQKSNQSSLSHCKSNSQTSWFLTMSPPENAIKANGNSGSVPWSCTILLAMNRLLTLSAQLIQCRPKKAYRTPRYDGSNVSSARAHSEHREAPFSLIQKSRL